MADVFISYSRRDGDFVRLLVERLETAGKTVWVDTDGIGDGEVFPDAIRQAIEGADAFVFVISPASASSAYCESEVDHALGLHKRLVPVLRLPVADDDLPEPVRVRNWIPFTEADDLDASSERLVRALDTDLAHARAHTHWLVQALEWDEHGRDSSFLLRGSELQAAEQWLVGVPEGADPAVTVLQREYVFASRRASTRRQRLTVAAALAALLVAVVLAGAALVSRNQATTAERHARDQATTARSRALAEESKNQVDIDPERALLLAMAAVRTQPTDDAVFALRQAIDQSPVRARLPNVGSQANIGIGPGLAYSPDGSRIAESSQHGYVLILDARTGAVIQRFKVPDEPWEVAWSPRGSPIAVGTSKGVRLLDPQTGAVLRRLPLPAGQETLVFSPDGAWVTLIGYTPATGGVALWNVDTGRVKTLLSGTQSGPVGANLSFLEAAFSPDGKRLYVGANPGVVAFDTRTGRVLARGDLHRALYWLAASPDGRYVAAADAPMGNQAADGRSVLLDAQTLRVVRVVARKKLELATAVAFSADSLRVGTGFSSGSLEVWSAATGQSLALRGHSVAINQIAFAPRGSRLASADVAGQGRVWSGAGPEQRVFASGVEPERAQLHSGDLRVESIADASRAIRSWSLSTGQPGRVIHVPGLGTQGADFSGDGRLLFTWTAPIAGAANQHVYVWEAATGRRVATVRLPGVLQGNGLVVPNFDGSQLAYATTPRALFKGTNTTRWSLATVDVASGRATVRVSVNCVGGWGSVTYDRRERRLAAGDNCAGVWVMPAQPGNGPPRKLRVKSAPQPLPVLTPDGSTIMLTDAPLAGDLTILDAATGTTDRIITTGEHSVDGLAASPDGRLIAFTGPTGMMHVIDARTGRLLRLLDQREAARVRFTADSRWIVTLTRAGGIGRVWDACTFCENPAALLALARTRVTRQLTPFERRTLLG